MVLLQVLSLTLLSCSPVVGLALVRSEPVGTAEMRESRVHITESSFWVDSSKIYILGQKYFLWSSLKRWLLSRHRLMLWQGCNPFTTIINNLLMYHLWFYWLMMLHASLPTGLQWESDCERTSLQCEPALLWGGVAKSAGHGCWHYYWCHHCQSWRTDMLYRDSHSAEEGPRCNLTTGFRQRRNRVCMFCYVRVKGLKYRFSLFSSYALNFILVL